MSVIAIVSLQAKPGFEQALASVLQEVAGPTRAQAGCISFENLRTEDQTRFVTVQHWDSRASHDRNIEKPHVRRFMAAVQDLLGPAPTMTWHETLSDA